MTPEVARRNRMRILLAFAAVYLLWGSTYLGIKYAVETIPPFMMGASRFLLAGLILYAAARMRGAPGPSRGDLRTAVITGIMMLALGNGAVIWAAQTVPSGIVALIVATVPVWMVLIDWFRPAGVRPRTMVFAGIALGIAGIATLIGPAALSANGGLDMFGAGVLILGSMSWALGSIVTRGGERPRSRLVTSSLQMIAGGVAFVLMSALFREGDGFSFGLITTRSFGAWTYLLFAGSLIGFPAYIYLLGAVSAAKAATYAYVNPVIAVLLGWAIAGEPLGTRTVVAAAIILGGVVIVTVTRSARGSTTGEHPVPAQPPATERSAA